MLLNEKEYLQIDTRKHTVYQYNAIGKRNNIFDLRLKESSVFEKISGENVTINWDGTFRLDITLFKERSQPAWNL